MTDSNIKINMNHIRNMQSNIERLQASSDSVVRSLTAVVRNASDDSSADESSSIRTEGSGKINEKNLIPLSKKYGKNLAERIWTNGPKGYGLKRSNIFKNWQFQGSPSFKDSNMTEVLEKWKKPGRAHKHDHFLHILDFLTHYFVNACEPVYEIQKYACRQSGKKGEDDNLKDFPESTVDFLRKFLLDALGLPDELSQSSSEHERNPNRWWSNLAGSNEERSHVYNELSEARMIWNGHIRTAIRGALTDIRAYHFKPERAVLLASKKKRIMASTEELSMDVIEKTEFVDSR